MYRNRLYLCCIFAGFILIASTAYAILGLQELYPENEPLNHIVKNHYIVDWCLFVSGNILFAGGIYLWHTNISKATKNLHELNSLLTEILEKKN